MDTANKRAYASLLPKYGLHAMVHPFCFMQEINVSAAIYGNR